MMKSWRKLLHTYINWGSILPLEVPSYTMPILRDNGSYPLIILLRYPMACIAFWHIWRIILMKAHIKILRRLEVSSLSEIMKKYEWNSQKVSHFWKIFNMGLRVHRIPNLGSFIESSFAVWIKLQLRSQKYHLENMQKSNFSQFCEMNKKKLR